MQQIKISEEISYILKSVSNQNKATAKKREYEGDKCHYQQKSLWTNG